MESKHTIVVLPISFFIGFIWPKVLHKYTNFSTSGHAYVNNHFLMQEISYIFQFKIAPYIEWDPF